MGDEMRRLARDIAVAEQYDGVVLCSLSSGSLLRIDGISSSDLIVTLAKPDESDQLIGQLDTARVLE